MTSPDAPLSLHQLPSLVRKHRTDNNLTLRSAAHQCDVSMETLAHVEAGELPRAADFERIIDWLGITADRFVHSKELQNEGAAAIIESHLAADPDLSVEAAEEILALIHELLQKDD